MQIQVSLDPHADAAADLRAQLEARLHALERPGVQVRAHTKAPDAEAFGEAYQFIVDCGPGIVALLPLVTAVLQLSTAILERRWFTPRKTNPKKKAKRARREREASESAPLVVSVNGRQIELPADERQLKTFMDAVSGRVTPRELVTGR